MAHPGGRPTLYNIELATEICEAVGSTSTGLKVLCDQNDSWPTAQTVYNWLRNNTQFFDMYQKAKKNQVQVLVDEILEISDDTSRDAIVNKHGDEVHNAEYVNRSRLRVETRKWIAAKLVPRLYGERIISENENNQENAQLKQEIEMLRAKLLKKSKKEY